MLTTNLNWRRASLSDAALLVELYNAAFRADFVRYGACPAYGRTLEQMASSITRFPKEIAFCNAVPVCVISWRAKGDGDYELGCLCVHPDWQRRGIGFAALEHLQILLSDWRKISLITPLDKAENLRFYTNKCGFHLAGEELDGNVPVARLCKKRMYQLETERLYLREMMQTDFFELCKILQDKDVMYAYEGPFSDTEVQDWLDRQRQRYLADKVGLWAVILKENNTMIGQCGLTMQRWNDRNLLEVGYLFQKAFWHCGYAAEAAKACMNYAFQVLHAEAVYSIIRDTNTASRRVAERNGMTVADKGIKHYRGIDMPHLLYKIDFGSW